MFAFKRIKTALGLGLILALVSCGRETHRTQGIIQELKPDGKTVVITHETIPGYMPAMTMPFEAKNPNELAQLKPGDRISFRIVATKHEGWIDQLRKIGATNPPAAPLPRSFRATRAVEPLEIGDPVPDYKFTNELGHAVSLAQFKGKAVALTFIFTRCPFPNFCPRMSERFGQTYQLLSSRTGGPTNWHLLSISFDTDYDTPGVLKAYAKRYSYDPQRWNFLTGALVDIDAITEQFGLVFPRSASGFDHNLRTAVLDSQGRVQRVFVGNEWTSDELVQEIIQAAKK